MMVWSWPPLVRRTVLRDMALVLALLGTAHLAVLFFALSNSVAWELAALVLAGMVGGGVFHVERGGVLFHVEKHVAVVAAGAWLARTLTYTHWWHAPVGISMAGVLVSSYFQLLLVLYASTLLGGLLARWLVPMRLR
jgi:hypothetical protein